MAQPGDSVDHVFDVRTSAGVAVTGLVTGDFTFTAERRTTSGTWGTFSHAAVVTELGFGKYGLRFSLPTIACQRWALWIAHTTYIVSVSGWEDELESADLASIAALVNRPVVRVRGSGTLGATAVLPAIVAWRESIIVITIEHADGSPVHLDSDYVYWTVGFRNQRDQTSASDPHLDAIHGTPTGFGIVPDDSGLLTITIPDDCSDLFDAIGEGITPDPSVTVDMEVTAVFGGTGGEIVSIIAPSPLTIRKRAVGSGAP